MYFFSLLSLDVGLTCQKHTTLMVVFLKVIQCTNVNVII